MTGTSTPSAELRQFWSEWQLSSFTTLRADGTPHVVPVGVTLDNDFGGAWIITSRGSVKVRNVKAAGPAGAPVAVSQVDRGRWSTLEGTAVVREDPDSVRAAENRYADRYGRQPQPNPERVVIVITVTRRLGLA
jgi:PPOX class probable F420-dependent enzyme